MNRLKVRDNSSNIFLGRKPFRLEDFDWIDKSVREAFYGLVSLFGVGLDKSFIISGCVITSTTCSAGYVCIDGEICKVDAHSLPAIPAGQVRYWAIDQTFDSMGNRPFQNGVSHDTFEVRKAKVVVGVAPALFTPPEAPRLENLIGTIAFNAIVAAPVDLHVVEDATTGLGTVFLNGWTAYNNEPVTFHKDVHGYLRIDGKVVIGGSSDVWVLPSGYRPAIERSYLVPKHTGIVPPAYVRVRILVNGTVEIGAADPTNTGEVIGLDGLSIPLF